MLSNLRAARLRAGMTQPQLAVALDVSITTISGIERGYIDTLRSRAKTRDIEDFITQHTPKKGRK